MTTDSDSYDSNLKLIRLDKSYQFTNVLKNCNIKIRSKYFVLLVVENNEVSNRIGIIIPKKNCKLASKRNLIKRFIREYFRIKYYNSLIKFDMIFRLSNTVKDISDRKLIRLEIESILNKFDKLLTGH